MMVVTECERRAGTCAPRLSVNPPGTLCAWCDNEATHNLHTVFDVCCDAHVAEGDAWVTCGAGS